MSTPSSKAKEIFVEVIGSVPPDQWENRLVEVAGDDEETLHRVRALLRAHVDPGSFLNEPAVVPQNERTVACDERSLKKPGETIGPYKLLEQIGEGGMGVVYMAEQTEPVQRRVALKIIKPGMDTQQVIARFEAERQALAAMEHPNIANVLDGGSTDNGRPYFVMELVSGIPITEFCDQQQLDVTHRLELFADVCRAVQHAHQKGIIHRDIKPSNILVTLYDGHPVPKVIDFGVAKAIRQTLTEQTIFTQLGQIVGTLEYMSPEQADTNQRDIDTRSDIYSLGVLLYELLTGETPFERQRLRSAAFDEIMRIIREEEPPRPSHRLSSSHSLPAVAASRQTEPKKLSTLVHGELDWIVMKALEKDRARRYETASGLAADVGRYLSNEPVEAGPPSVRYRFSKFVRRNRAMIVTAALILVLLVAGIAGTAWQAARATREQRRTAAALATSLDNEQKAEQAAAESKSVVRFLVDDLLGSAAPEKSLGRELTVKETLTNAEDKIQTAFKDQPLVEAHVRGTIGEVYYRLGKYELAEPHLTASLEIRSRLLGDDDLLTLWTKDKLAVVLMDRGQLGRARKLLEQTVAFSRRELGEEDDSTLVYMNDLARVLYAQGELKEARRLFEQILEIQRRVLGEGDRATLQTMNNLANVYADQGQLEEARQLYEETFETLRAMLGEEHPQTLLSMGNLAIVLHQQGQLDAARRLYEQAVTISRRILGEEHPSTLDVMNNLAIVFYHQGQLEEAAKLHQQLLEVRSRILGEEHSDTLKSINNLALVFKEQGRLEEACRLFEQAVQISRRVFGTEHFETASRMYNLADTFYARGQLDEARRLYEQTQEIQRRVLGADHPDTLDSMNNLAEVLRQQGQLEEAGRLHEQTLKDRRRILGAEDRATLASMNNLALVFRERGQLDDAHKLHEETLEIQRRVLGEEHRETLRSMTNLAKVIGKQGHLNDARRLHEQTLETKRRVLGEEDRDTLVSMDALAPLLNKLGDLQAYFKLQEQIFDIRRRVLGPEHPHTLIAMNNLAWSMVIDPDKPFADAERAVELASKAVEVHPQHSAYLSTLGLAHYRTSNWMAAIEVLETALNQPGDEGQKLCCLAMAHWQLDHQDEARRYYDQALEGIHFDMEVRRFIAEASRVLGLTDPFATNSYSSLDEMTRQPLVPPIVPFGHLIHIDLQPVANQPLSNLSSDEGESNDLNDLPRGEQTLARVKFRIGEKLIQLGGPLNQAKEIQVGMKMARLYLLHATQWGGSIADDTEIGLYRVHFQDETSSIIPVTVGKDVRDWWNNDNSSPVSRAVVAWKGTNLRSLKHGATLRLYAGMWENPKPDKEVSHIEYMTANTAAAPFCVAMTVEEPSTTSEKRKAPLWAIDR